ncbi:hypothetical protein [Klebsiella sp. B-Nf7]|uniref:hypothetical protein n=1 Tax=Klebsiella sp. B-Nf7 TaxID=2054607 RepID=UPI0029DE655F|nr:hypothetical protein [Klebsiella sp. B-Nf7]
MNTYQDGRCWRCAALICLRGRFLRKYLRKYLRNRRLILIQASETVQLLRRLCADYPFGQRFS